MQQDRQAQGAEPFLLPQKTPVQNDLHFARLRKSSSFCPVGKKAQGAIEYMLIIGGMIVVVSIVIVATTGAINNSKAVDTSAQIDYNNNLNALRGPLDQQNNLPGPPAQTQKTFVYLTDANFDSGTPGPVYYNNIMAKLGGNNGLHVTNFSQALNASYTSGVFNSGSDTTTFQSYSFNKTTPVLYGKELTPASDTSFTSNLLALWNFDETSGTNFSDASGNNHNATCTGAACPALERGLWDTNARRFNGSTQSLRLANSSSIAAGGASNNQLTIGAWINIPSDFSNDGVIIAKGDGTPANGSWELGVTTAGGLHTKFTVFTSSSGLQTITGTNTLSPNTWYFITAVSYGSQLKIFINGGLDNAIAIPSSSFKNPTADVNIGRRTNGTAPFKGVIEEVAVWNNTFSDAYPGQLFIKYVSKYGVQYKVCQPGDSTCTIASWVPVTPNQTQGQITPISSTQGRYFRFLVKPIYLQFTGFAGGCSGTPVCYTLPPYETCDSAGGGGICQTVFGSKSPMGYSYSYKYGDWPDIGWGYSYGYWLQYGYGYGYGYSYKFGYWFDHYDEGGPVYSYGYKHGYWYGYAGKGQCEMIPGATCSIINDKSNCTAIGCSWADAPQTQYTRLFSYVNNQWLNIDPQFKDLTLTYTN